MVNYSAQKKILQAHSFIAVIKRVPVEHGEIGNNIKADHNQKIYHVFSDDKKIEVAVILRKNEKTSYDFSSKGCMTLLLGDGSEWRNIKDYNSMANAVIIEYDLTKKYIKILSSIVGLPPVFVYQESDKTIITSDLYLLSSLPGIRLSFDSEGIIDLFKIGHPIGYRTLFNNCSMMPGGYLLALEQDGNISMIRQWHMPETVPLKNWDSYIDLQIEAFKNACYKLDLSESFLSLTAGLDTRTILAALIKENIYLPAYTMSGKTISLDAKIAIKLSKAYKMKHETIVIDNEFYRDLPDYTLEASRLSGGLASIEQASEVYFYKKIHDYPARVSGNLGNQVGRGGTEKISMRNTDISILNEQISNINIERQKTAEHWYKDAKVTDGTLDYEFLLQNEVPFSSVANYSIGNYFAIQQSPYANRQLIENLQFKPKSKDAEKSLSLTKMRLKDLRHRFIGEPEIYSFQRRLIKKTGGYVASCPINWGWRAEGGVSLSGLVDGCLTFLDAITHAKDLNSGLIGEVLKKTHVRGLHEFRHYTLWMNSYMKEFVCDTMLSDCIKNSGLFNVKRLTKILDEHYSNRNDHYKILVTTLDIALAKQIFNAKL